MKLIKLIFSLLLIAGVSRAQINVKGRVDHIIPDGTDTLGNIYLTVSGGTSPYTYTWNPGGTNNKDLTDVTANTYTVTVKDNVAATAAYKYKLGYKTRWTNFISSFIRRDTLFGLNTAPNYPYSGLNSSISKNTLKAGTDGWVQWVVNTTAFTTYLGFIDSISVAQTGSVSDFDYGLAHSGSNLYRTAGGTNTSLGTFVAGDVFRMERVGTTLTYYKNSVSVYSVTVSTSKDWKLKVGISGSAHLNDIGASFIDTASVNFPNYVEDIPNIVHVTPGSSNGSIKLSPRISGTTHTYTWSTSATTNSITGLSIGNYSVDIKDSDLNLTKYNFNVGYKTYWTNFFGTKFRNDTLMFQSPTSATGWNTAVSKNTLKASTDGWVEVVTRSLNDVYMVGFFDGASGVPGTYSDMDYGVYLSAGRIYRILSGSYTILTSFRAGDVIRIERIGSTFYIKINGITLNSVTCATSMWKLKTVMNNCNVWNIGASFKDTTDLFFPNYVQDKPLIKHCTPGASDGSIKLTPKISGTTHSYTWTASGATTNSISGLSFGQYSVNIMDVDSNTSNYNYNVGYKTYWTNFYGTKSRNDSILFQSPTSPSGWNTAVSKNTLKAGTDGWIEYVVGTTTSFNKFGFLDSATAVNGYYQDIDYGISFNSNQLWRYLSSGLTFLGAYEVGDVLRIERIGTTFYYKQNGVIINSFTCSNTRDWKIKAVLNNETMCNIGASFYDSTASEFINYIQLNVAKVHTNWCSYEGKISVTPKFSGSYTYSWQPGFFDTTSTISNKDAGTYNVKVTDHDGNKSSYKYNIGYKLAWATLYNSAVSGDTLKNTGTNWAAAVSTNTIPGNVDTWYEYIVPSTSYNQVIGFLDSSITISSYSDIDYGLYLEGNTRSIFRIVGGATTYLSYYTVGDIMTIERKNGNIYYRINGHSLYSVSVPTVTLAKTWKAKAMMYGSGSRIIGPGISLPIVTYNGYETLKKQLDGGYYTTANNKLYFTLDGEYSNMTLTNGVNYGVYDYNRNLQTSVTISSSSLNNGDNRYQLNIGGLASGYYVLEVFNQKKEKLQLRFKK